MNRLVLSVLIVFILWGCSDTPPEEDIKAALQAEMKRDKARKEVMAGSAANTLRKVSAAQSANSCALPGHCPFP